MDLADRLEPTPAAVDGLSAASAPPPWAEAFGEARAALATQPPRLVWATAAWQRRAGPWAAADLARVVRAARACSATDTPPAWRCEMPGPAGEPAQLQVQCADDDPATLWLRLAEPDAARSLQRHLEDRERLLFTSRSVSIGEMASTLAHEINQPIGTVSNVLRGLAARLTQLQADHAGDAELDQRITELQQGTRLALDQALFAARVIGRIREYTHSRQPQRERLDLATLARDSAALLDWAFARQGVPLQVSVGGPAWVVGDAVMLQQVVVNLLRNALDAHRDTANRGAAVALGLGQVEAEWQLAITDRGGGISREAEDRLFVPFVSSKPDGMGLGLKICRSFIELHQGRLWFTRNAEAEGGGCTFHIALRAAQASGR
jgi:two-component system, LuxR family, sensor kinase FixL